MMKSSRHKINDPVGNLTRNINDIASLNPQLFNPSWKVSSFEDLNSIHKKILKDYKKLKEIYTHPCYKPHEKQIDRLLRDFHASISNSWMEKKEPLLKVYYNRHVVPEVKTNNRGEYSSIPPTSAYGHRKMKRFQQPLKTIKEGQSR